MPVWNRRLTRLYTLEDRMLILTRRIGETVNIGENIQVTVLRIEGNRVRIGVEAPKSVPVHRVERVINTRRKQQSE